MHKVAGTASVRALLIGMLKPGVVNSEAQSPDTGRKGASHWLVAASVGCPTKKGSVQGHVKVGARFRRQQTPYIRA